MSTFVFKQIESDVGLSGSASVSLQEIKKGVKNIPFYEWRVPLVLCDGVINGFC